MNHYVTMANPILQKVNIVSDKWEHHNYTSSNACVTLFVYCNKLQKLHEIICNILHQFFYA